MTGRQCPRGGPCTMPSTCADIGPCSGLCEFIDIYAVGGPLPCRLTATGVVTCRATGDQLRVCSQHAAYLLAKDPDAYSGPLTDPAASFDQWARDELDDYPTICDGGPERVYIRGGEARRLLKRAYLAGWHARPITQPDSVTKP